MFYLTPKQRLLKRRHTTLAFEIESNFVAKEARLLSLPGNVDKAPSRTRTFTASKPQLKGGFGILQTGIDLLRHRQP